MSAVMCTNYRFACVSTHFVFWILHIFLTGIVCANCRCYAEDLLDPELREGIASVQKKCDALRSSGIFKYEGNTSYQFFDDDGRLKKLNFVVLEELAIANKQFCATSSKIVDGKVVAETIRILNKKNIFQCEKNGDGYSLSKAAPIRPNTNPFEIAEYGERHFFLNCALRLTPPYLLDLSNDDFLVTRCVKTGAGWQCGFEFRGFPSVGQTNGAKFDVVFDSMCRVSSTVRNEVKDGVEIKTLYKVEYESIDSIIPVKIENQRTEGRAAYSSKAVLHKFQYEKSDWDLKRVTPEFYGITQAALDAMSPNPTSEPFSLQFWTWLVVAVLCFAISALLTRKLLLSRSTK